MKQKAAIIDLGSNSARVIIMQIFDDGSYKMIDQGKAAVRLSEGMSEDLHLKAVAMQRAVNTLKLFRKLIDSHEVTKVFAVATAAVRNSMNGVQFLERVKRETDFDFVIASGAEESYFDYIGVINAIDLRNCVIVDTGGGSTEIVLVRERKLRHAISIPYGAVVMTEKFPCGKDDAKAVQRKMEAFIADKIKTLRWLEEGRGMPVVGLGGSIRNLAKIHKNANGYFIDGLHNYWMDAAGVQSIYDRITDLAPNERKKLLGLSKDRAGVIAGGLAPLKAIMDHIGSKELVISGSGLREGIFYRNFHRECGMDKEIVENVLEHSLENIMKKYETSIPHGRQVCRLALSMFDQMPDIHGLDPSARRLLEVGALLHDIGLYVDYYDHHSHGFYLALNSGINGLNHKELLFCGFIIAMHRSEDFNRDWRDFSLYMDQKDYDAVKKLGMFVRIAEALDRNEYGHVEQIDCITTADSVKLLLTAKKAADLEIAAAKLSGKAFKKLFGKKLVLEYK